MAVVNGPLIPVAAIAQTISGLLIQDECAPTSDYKKNPNGWKLFIKHIYTCLRDNELVWNRCLNEVAV